MSTDLAFLLEAAGEGDNKAAVAFVTETRSVLWRLCRALGSGDDTDDLVQETYLRAFRSQRARHADGNVMAWLLTLGRRVCADAVRERQRQRLVLDRVVRLFPRDRVPSTAHAAVLFDHLDDPRREAFVLTQVAGFSYDEAAEICGCPVGTIRSRVARARRDLLAAELSSNRDFA
jgi:RNA polymerase sigma-70 factor, ECF subfamily